MTRPPRGSSIRAQRTARPCTAWNPIIDDVCLRHRQSRREVIGGLKSPEAVWTRNEIWWSLHYVRGISLGEIGRRFGFHHTTVMHGVRQWSARVEGVEDKCAA